MKAFINKNQLNKNQQEKIKEVYTKLISKNIENSSDIDEAVISNFIWLFGNEIEKW